MFSKKRKRSLLAVTLAILVLGSVTGCDAGAGSLKNRTEAALAEWTKEWKEGDISSLRQGLIIEKKAQTDSTEKEEPESASDADSREQRTNPDNLAKLQEEFGGLVAEKDSKPEEMIAAETEDSVLTHIMKYTEISYTLPKKLKEGEEVAVTITGPDMEKVLASMQAVEPDDKAALMNELEKIFAAGSYESKTSNMALTIAETEDEIELTANGAFYDALYGGLLSLYTSEFTGLYQ